ncbi:ATP-dependent helicase [Paenibacillus sambharensis]|uniref:ATP-dependent helicase n=1 Tax=Paenibacillus sambharensis TaxID=1803190 RepID=A0A2W1LLP2_9BACL|nr:DEAD/DEAH box helicase [Paenibacillus sambharensis]PZD95785.1 ATP-dependent helicase [Paenibacillus sambharensis]
MNGTTSIRACSLDGIWLAGEGLWLTADDWHGTVERLRKSLFGWHSGSWFGEQITKKVNRHTEGLLLSPLMAVDYMSEPRPVHLLKVEWSERLAVLRDAAAWIRTAMMLGWFAPDLRYWSQGERAWKPSPPESDPAAAEQWRELLERADALKLEGLEQWLSEALEELFASDEEAGEALRSLLVRTGAELSGRSAADEEDWLVSIGWKSDDTPFRIALQLLEPDEEHQWKLAVHLQDREYPEQSFVLRERTSAVSGAAGTDSWPGLDDCPPSWEPWLSQRLAKEEDKWLAVLPEIENPAHPGTIRLAVTEQEAWEFLQHGSLKLLQAGCAVMLPSWWEAVRTRRVRLKAKVKSSVGSGAQPMFGLNQIVQFDWKLAVGNLDLTEEDFSRLAEENRRLLKIGGEWVHLDPKDIQLVKSWIKKAGKTKGMTFRDVLEWHLRGEHPLDAGENAEDNGMATAVIELNEHLAAWIDQLQHAAGLPPVNKPQSFMGELRPYQLEGVSWLAFLRRFGLGGCLADDMGLGKTVQFTAYLLHIKEQNEAAGVTESHPSLLICPTSVIGNWEKELERFAPDLTVYVHYGPRRTKGEAFREAVRGADLVLTSYALAPLDEEELTMIEWDALCLDEAQNIKNVYTKQSSAIRRLPARHRIALTGTPMENRLTELWSIHDFMNPGYLGSLGEFRSQVVQPIERSRDEALIRQLQQWVKPFMLRRLKKDPAIQLSLPDKNEAKTFVSLTAEQGVLYENTVNELLEGLDDLSPMKRRGLILATLTRLKQICNHPSLMLGDIPGGPASWEAGRSGKVIRLLEMVEELAAEGDRCLIFTQFIDMGAMIKAKLEEQLGMPVPYLHGGVAKNERDAMIQNFQDTSKPGCAFVLSLKAGGTGLNLTAANHVFHFDRWWNPAVENQATDRAFRIGQTKDVQVHKFVTIGTLEERIDDMLTRKQSMNDQVVGQSEGWITELGKDELKALFTLRRTWFDG